MSLAWSLWTLDLSVAYVADHARDSIGPFYRLAGLWGGASGSLLLFSAMVALPVAAMAAVASPIVARTATRFGGGTVAAFALSVLVFANPFGRLDIPAISGGGLQPILEHPAMLYHPPLLYAGLVSTIGPWIISLTARDDPTWRRRVRPWLAVSLVVLTIGQLTGSNWAYVELGWGGFWGWDPVENAVLAAWLFVLAALHIAGQPGHQRLVAWLCAAPWIAVLVCTTITRAGIGDSVHAFADDDRIAIALFAIIAATIAATTWQIRAANSQRLPLRTLPTVAVAIMSLAAIVVLEGVLYPLVVRGDPLVTGHFYATVLAPLALMALVGSSLALSRQPWWWSAAGGGIGLGLGTLGGASTAFALGVAAGVGAVIAGMIAGILPTPSRATTSSGTVVRGPIRWSTRLGHLGVAVLLIGVAGSTQAERTTITLQPDERTELGGVTFTHRGVDVIDGPTANSTSVTATLDITGLDITGLDVIGQRTAVTMQPALVAHTTRNVLLAETALHSRPLSDVQVVLRSAADDGSARYDLAVTPLVQMVWWGSIMIALAGALIVAGHRRGKHDPSRGDSGDRYGGGRRSLRRSSRVRSSNDAMVADSAATSERATSSRIAASSAAGVDATTSLDAPADAPR